MDFRGKVVLVTGASSGIGREAARLLAGRGAKLVLVARNGEALGRLASELASMGAEALPVVADVTDRSALDAAVAAAIARFGRLDVLVNNAGLGYFGPVETMAMEDFDRVMKTNVYGLVDATQAALAELKKNRGMIVNVSSGLALRALPLLAAYSGSKAMVNALSDGLRLEAAPYGIKVLVFCPPATDTGFSERSIKGSGMEKAAAGKMRMAPTSKVAADLVRAMERERRQVGGAFMRAMNFFAPRAMDRMFAGMVRNAGKEN